MKYFKILLIPVLILMLMVPTKAANDLPDWAYTDNYYFVTEAAQYGFTYVYVITSKDNLVIKNNGVYVKRSLVTESYRHSASNDRWVSNMTGGSYSDINGESYRLLMTINSDSSVPIYSNFDMVVNGQLLFPRTPVINLAIATQMAVETLETEVQGTSGIISAVGGVILGLMLVPVLVSRLRHWAMR